MPALSRNRGIRYKGTNDWIHNLLRPVRRNDWHTARKRASGETQGKKERPIDSYSSQGLLPEMRRETSKRGTDRWDYSSSAKIKSNVNWRLIDEDRGYRGKAPLSDSVDHRGSSRTNYGFWNKLNPATLVTLKPTWGSRTNFTILFLAKLEILQ